MSSQQHSELKEIELHVLNAGQANFCVLKWKANGKFKFIVVDAGFPWTGDPSVLFDSDNLKQLFEYSPENQSSRVVAIFFTHPHKDHFYSSGTSGFLLREKLGFLFDESTKFFFGGSRKNWDAKYLIPSNSEFFQTCKGNFTFIDPRPGSKITTPILECPLCDGISFTIHVLDRSQNWQSEAYRKDQNNWSYALSIYACGRSLLFTGDVYGKTFLEEANLASLSKLRDCSICILPHHGCNPHKVSLLKKILCFIQRKKVKESTWFAEKNLEAFVEFMKPKPSNKVFVFCSNPTETSCVPYADAEALFEGFGEVPLHNYSYNCGGGKRKTKLTAKPIFVTCDEVFNLDFSISEDVVRLRGSGQTFQVIPTLEPKERVQLAERSSKLEVILLILILAAVVSALISAFRK